MQVDQTTVNRHARSKVAHDGVYHGRCTVQAPVTPLASPHVPWKRRPGNCRTGTHDWLLEKKTIQLLLLLCTADCCDATIDIRTCTHTPTCTHVYTHRLTKTKHTQRCNRFNYTQHGMLQSRFLFIFHVSSNLHGCATGLQVHHHMYVCVMVCKSCRRVSYMLHTL